MKHPKDMTPVEAFGLLFYIVMTVVLACGKDQFDGEDSPL